jgi:hypothetical protein
VGCCTHSSRDAPKHVQNQKSETIVWKNAAYGVSFDARSKILNVAKATGSCGKCDSSKNSFSRALNGQQNASTWKEIGQRSGEDRVLEETVTRIPPLGSSDFSKVASQEFVSQQKIDFSRKAPKYRMEAPFLMLNQINNTEKMIEIETQLLLCLLELLRSRRT